MSDINVFNVVGRLTRDAEISYTQSGHALLKFSVAVGRSVKRNGQWEDDASFFDCTLWGKRGESLSQYMHKGSQVALSGEMVQDRWEKDGQKRSKVVLNVGNIQLVGGKRDDTPASNTPTRPSHDQDGMSGFEDDIPF